MNLLTSWYHSNFQGMVRKIEVNHGRGYLLMSLRNKSRQISLAIIFICFLIPQVQAGISDDAVNKAKSVTKAIKGNVANITNNDDKSPSSQYPSCNAILLWGAKAYTLDTQFNISNFWGGKYKGKHLLAALGDDIFKPTFGTTFGQWTDKDIKEFEPIASSCREEYARSINKERAASRGNAELKERYHARVKLYGNGGRYIVSILNPLLKPASRVNAYPSLMAHQRFVYSEYKKALSLIDAQQAIANAMSATQENIRELSVMAKNPQFAYLQPTIIKKHSAFLDSRSRVLSDQIITLIIAELNELPDTLAGLKELQTLQRMNPSVNRVNPDSSSGMKMIRNVRQNKTPKSARLTQAFATRTNAITAKIVDNAINNLASFSNDLDGLRKLVVYRTEVQNSMSGASINHWPKFEKNYALAVNEKAAIAIQDFEQELNSLSSTPENLKIVQKSVNHLFKYPPPPANHQAYFTIAQKREKTILLDLKKVTCYKALDNIALKEEDRASALLGYSGETTLGLFICAINKRGYKFQEYDTSGFFSGTSTLSILSPRGITLSISMKKVTAAKDREMLVGVLLKDAVSEKEFTLNSWQDYAEKLSK
ncbi:MAG: hypothetical protein V7784_13210 [Oceanospirillaceae bacterium]